MNRVKRWTTAVTAQIDEWVAKVENHEALASSVICEVRRAAARAKVQLARVKKDGERLRQRLEEERRAERRWRERARSCAESDRERALECLRRSKRAAAMVPRLETRLETHDRAETQLGRDVRRIEDRLAALQQQRNLMRTRQSRAEALSSVGGDTAGSGDVDDLFDRWDVRITELEIEGCEAADLDSLEVEYEEAEEREELLEELAALCEGGSR